MPPLHAPPRAQTRPPYAKIVLDRAGNGLDDELTYAIPENLRAQAQIGASVLVPFGHQQLSGFISGFTNALDFDAAKLKAILRVLSEAPLFDENALAVARWMSAYYHCSLGECLMNFVPVGARRESEKRYSFAFDDFDEAARVLSRSPRRLKIAQCVQENGGALSQKEIEKICGGDAAAMLRQLVSEGWLREDNELREASVKPLKLPAVMLTPEAIYAGAPPEKMRRAAPRQAAALEQLLAHHLSTQDGETQPVPTQNAARDWNIESSIWRALEAKGYVAFTEVEVQRAPQKQLPPPDTELVELTGEQTQAVKIIGRALQFRHQPPLHITEKPPHIVLLQGVTASGKTEVYLRAIEKCLSLGKRALVLVPEIALTAQTVEIFQRRFQDKVAILHSALGAGERFDEWRRAHAGQAQIIVGARSAVFAPCRDLGLIIIDEEHDGSYKQDSSPRYHARDVAMKRAHIENAVVVLGSATPSLESYRKATRSEYSHVLMKNRIGERKLPEVEIIDMTGEAKNGAMPVLSTRLKSELVETVKRGEQAILFLNRRGFASYVQCLGCGHVEKCPNCDVSLTYHRGERSLRCHHCDHAARVLEECPECKGWMIGFSGTGTEKVESEVRDLLMKNALPDIGVLRLDRDTTVKKGAHAHILSEFRKGKARVLIGTQMVTKGLDFPNVTLVGVVAADSALNMPDFRAGERTFQLLAQVAGRAGRGERAGRVLVQALAANHPVVEAARAQDFEAFVGEELEARESLRYPPFGCLANIVSQDESEGVAKARLQKLAIALGEAIEREADERGATELLGPVDCPISRVRNKFRFHLMLRDRNRPRLHRVLRVFDALPREARSGLTIDIDPLSLL